MSLRVTGTSAAEFYHIAGRLYKADARDLTRVLKKAQRDAVKPLQEEIKAEALATLPKRGTYNAVMSKAIKVTATGGTPGKRLTVNVYAKGKDEERDVRAVNNGILRHPTFGHRGRWHTTRVRPGFVDRPIKQLEDQVIENSGREIEKLLEELARA